MYEKRWLWYHERYQAFLLHRGSRVVFILMYRPKPGWTYKIITGRVWVEYKRRRRLRLQLYILTVAPGNRLQWQLMISEEAICYLKCDTHVYYFYAFLVITVIGRSSLRIDCMTQNLLMETSLNSFLQFFLIFLLHGSGTAACGSRYGVGMWWTLEARILAQGTDWVNSWCTSLKTMVRLVFMIKYSFYCIMVECYDRMRQNMWMPFCNDHQH